MAYTPREPLLRYGSSEEVIRLIKFNETTFGFDTEADFDAYITGILNEAMSVINSYAKDFRPTTELTELVNGVANDYVVNRLKYAVQVTIPSNTNDFNDKSEKWESSNFFTKAMQDRIDTLTPKSISFYAIQLS